jgi:hypothetical protein
VTQVRRTTLQVERIGADDHRFGIAKRWEYEIFGRENNYTSVEDDAVGEMCLYRSWEKSSEFFVGFAEDDAAGDGDGRPVAILRALRWNRELGIDSFSTVRDARAYPDARLGPVNKLYPAWRTFFADAEPSAIAELATQAVRRTRRRTGVMEEVWRHFFATLTEDGVRYVTVALVVPLFHWYQMLIGDAIEQIGAVLPDYVGADSIPAIVDIEGLKSTNLYR